MRRLALASALLLVLSPSLVAANSASGAGPADTISLSITRVGAGQVAKGTASPVIPGRLFELQYKSGSVWKRAGAKVAESPSGLVKKSFGLSGVSRTTPRTYRLVGDAVDGSAAVSRSVPFAPGPQTLGAHVLYVLTDSGATPTTKGVDYKGTAVVDGSDPLRLETVAVRGNSSATKPKKPYKLKFEDKQTPFDLPRDRTWILLANYGDRTLVRSKVAWDLGDQLDGLKWTPKSVFTELFLNGKYLGSYQIVQSIKIDNNRVNVDKVAGQVMEVDPHYVEDGVPGFKGQSGLPFSFKDPDEFKKLADGTQDPEGLTAAKVSGMTSKIKKFEKVLYAKDWSKVNFGTLAPADDWTTYLDLSSAVDYYIAREFTKDNDADFYRSNFFYTNNYSVASADKLFMGPIWDFDRSAGAATGASTTIASPKGWWMRGNGSPNHDTNKIHWYVRIAKDPRFLAALKLRWNEKRLIIKAISTTGVDSAVAALGTTVAENDRQVWSSYGSRYDVHSSTYVGEINYLKGWYKNRFNWIDAEIN
ncbi:MAG: CotH kinase family protein [Aeromicrobium sp.]